MPVFCSYIRHVVLSLTVPSPLSTYRGDAEGFGTQTSVLRPPGMHPGIHAEQGAVPSSSRYSVHPAGGVLAANVVGSAIWHFFALPFATQGPSLKKDADSAPSVSPQTSVPVTSLASTCSTPVFLSTFTLHLSIAYAGTASSSATIATANTVR